jgi:hypothetical protein
MKMIFSEWWEEIGSSIVPKNDEDHEEHARVVAMMSWEACVEDCAKVCDKQDGMHNTIYSFAIRSGL